MAARISREEFRAYAALIASSTLLQRAVERNLREQAELTQVQFEILMNLSNAGDSGIRMAQLADALIVSRSGLSYQVAQLESRGWITRERSADDERGVVVLGTGKRLFEPGAAPTALRLVDSRPMGKGAVLATYQPVGKLTYGEFKMEEGFGLSDT